MRVELWAEHYERCTANMGELTERSFGSNKECHYGHWIELWYSQFTGWSQVLFWCESPQSDVEILKITYYSSAIAALQDHSIFPPGSRVWFL